MIIICSCLQLKPTLTGRVQNWTGHRPWFRWWWLFIFYQYCPKRHSGHPNPSVEENCDSFPPKISSRALNSQHLHAGWEQMTVTVCTGHLPEMNEVIRNCGCAPLFHRCFNIFTAYLQPVFQRIYWYLHKWPSDTSVCAWAWVTDQILVYELKTTWQTLLPLLVSISWKPRYLTGPSKRDNMCCFPLQC